MREAVCSELNYLGIELDPAQNTAYNGELKEINKASAKVKILVIPTNEEYEIAHQCFELID
jgi:acetate kinase